MADRCQPRQHSSGRLEVAPDNFRNLTDFEPNWYASQMNLTVYNERIKYFATLLNTMAAAAISIGIFAPFVAALYSTGAAQPFAPWPAIALGSIL